MSVATSRSGAGNSNSSLAGDRYRSVHQSNTHTTIGDDDPATTKNRSRAAASRTLEADDPAISSGDNDTDASNTAADLFVTPSTLEVDYDKNLTELYQAIVDENWIEAVAVAERDPLQAATWVVRHYQDENSELQSVVSTGRTSTNPGEPEIMWRFLPLHSACARQPPASVITSLLKAYPDAAKCVDDQGMYALHYACGNQAPASGIRQLLVHFPRAALQPDPRGMLPLHYLACWGPSHLSVVDMLLVATKQWIRQRDHDGNTPLDLAVQGDYPEASQVADALRKWKSSSSGSHHKGSKSQQQQQQQQQSKSSSSKHTAAVERQQHERKSSYGSHRQTHDEDNKNSSTTNVIHINDKSPRNASGKQEEPNKDRKKKSTADDAVTETEAVPFKVKQVHRSSNNAPSPVPSHHSHKSAASTSSRYQQQQNQKHSHHHRSVSPEKYHQSSSHQHHRRQQSSNSNNNDINKTNNSKTQQQPQHSADHHSVISASTVATHGNQTHHTTTTSSSDRGDQSSNSVLNRSIPPVRSSGLESQHSHKSDSANNVDKATLQRTVQEQATELETVRAQLAAGQEQLAKAQKALSAQSSELADTKHQLQQSRSECHGLQTTLGDLMEQHEQLKRQSTNTHDRLASLSVSLTSMREQQDYLVETVSHRNSHYQQVTAQRRDLLKQLQGIDEQICAAEDKVGAALQKQTREMEAIAAVINAARYD